MFCFSSIAEVRNKELEIEETKEAMQRAERLQTIKRKKRELDRLERELVKLRQEEQVVKVPVARLFQLLNTQLDSKIESNTIGNGSIEEEEAKPLEKLFMCGSINKDEDDHETLGSALSMQKMLVALDTADSDSLVDHRRGRVEGDGMCHVLDVICG